MLYQLSYCPRVVASIIYQSGLPGFLVDGMFAVPPAVLLHFDSITIVVLVLRGYIVTPLAVFARKCNLNSLLVLCHVV